MRNSRCAAMTLTSPLATVNLGRATTLGSALIALYYVITAVLLITALAAVVLLGRQACAKT